MTRQLQNPKPFVIVKKINCETTNLFFGQAVRKGEVLWSRGRSVIVMTHRPAAIAECDLLMVIENGGVTALGPRDEVLRDKLRNAEPVRTAMRSGGPVAS